MKKRRIWSFLMAFFLLVTSVQMPVQAETGTVGMTGVTITDENRYEPQLYQKPETIYPVSKSRTSNVREQQTLEERILEGLKNFEERIDVSGYKIPNEKPEASNRYFQILNSHPELFYVGNSVSWSYSKTDNMLVSYTPQYLGAPDEIRQQQQEFEIAADQAAAQVEPSMTDLQKALVVHDYLVQLCEYDKERLDTNTVPAVSHTAYGALVNHICVCDGYGKAFSYVMQSKLNVPCVLVSSDSMNHAWNMIQIDGNWYHVDATWDDPVWDRIGRVGHDFFLLSDSAIQDQDHRHSGWVTDLKAESTEYDDAYWSGVTSGIYFHQGAWHYSMYKDGKVNLVKRSDLLNGEAETICAENAWTAGGSQYYTSGFMYLSKVNGQLYYNTNQAIKRLKEDASAETVLEPQLAAGQQIYGFTIRGNNLCYVLQESPGMSAKQQILEHEFSELELPEITGISAEKTTAVYDGTAKEISLSGLQQADQVWYAGEDGIFAKEHPEIVDAGTYTVLYRVERTGYQVLYGSAQLEIEKAAPTYTIPVGLTGFSGSPLSSVGLRNGFSWMDRNVKMYQQGTHKFLARYTPSDSKNYLTVADIEIEVTVACPYASSGHKYVSEITKEPTETEPGERTKTCSMCGDVQIEVIPATNPGQQVPEYTVPTGLKGESGKTLGSVELPAGFEWQTDPETKLYQEGTYEYVVTYTPEDTEKYQIVTDIKVEVTVECPGHQYTSEVTKEPTQTEAGERTKTCSVCGDVQTEEIPKLDPDKQKPAYTVPTGLRGESGKTLGSVELPAGFEWQTDPETKLYQEGTYEYVVTYTPEDTEKYQIVTDIKVEVTVECPGHQYTSEVTKEPTQTEAGERTKTCSVCGDVQTEEIPKLDPDKQKPAYTVPTGLKGESGKTLGSVELPAGFEWQTDPETKLYQEGTYEYVVTYTPEDTEKYQIVTDIKVEVTVECPGHQYTSEVTKEPTQTEAGERTKTCNVCGDVQTEEIPKLDPDKQKPAYTVPTGLRGESGKTLGSVELPAGFEWQTDPETKLYQEGTYEYVVTYTPEDTEKYQIVTDIKVEVTVECPGHQYTSEVTKEPTQTEAGERTKTCSVCGDVQTEEIPKLDPDKQKPAYTVPTGLRGESGKTLGSVELPAGFEWQTDPGTKLYQEGTYEYVVTYTPEDTEKYQIVTDIKVEVTVECPGHQYTSEVTKEPTQTEAGERTKTCSVCGDVQTEEIPKLDPDKQKPAYTVPTGLRGESGKTLGSVELPAGFEWQTDPETKLYQEGTYEYVVTYTPEDTEKYQIVTDIKVEVTVECPGHQYTSEVTKEPTQEEAGERTKTCSVCGDVQTEEIPKLPPIQLERPGKASGLKLKKYQAKSLSFTWKKGDASGYRLVFKQGNKKISTKYVIGNSCTFTKLKAATIYTVEVTPYYVVNRTKIYASAATKLQAATAPAAVKLSSAKQNGKTAVKLTWKKASGANGYQIFMKSGKGSYKKIKTITKGKTISFLKSKLKKGTSYQFRVRAYKELKGKNYYGSYSKVKTVKIRKK